GPKAAQAAPKILSMMREPANQFLNSRYDELEWLLTLRLMGVTEQDLRRELRGKPKEIAETMGFVEKEVQKYRQKENGHK
ncbi:MAG: hypothetical protein ACK6A7_01855, partial [Planctomycetota bacterium]